MSEPFVQARWVWTADPGDHRFAVRRFRGAFVAAEAQRLICHVSADSRYILYLDGQLVGRGPARSDLRHTIYETYTFDVEPGRHVLAAVAIAYGADAGPIAE